MATSQPTTASLQDQVDFFLASIGQGFNACLERRGRMDEIARLNAKSDEELEEIGLTRDRIPQHVFRDALVW